MTIAANMNKLLDDQAGYSELVKLFTLPNLPSAARKILQLNLTKNYSIAELARIISADAAVQQQILNFAKLSLPSIEPESERVQHIIEHILGFETVSHIALGVSAGSAFGEQNNIDLHSFWLHALCCAALAEAIANKIKLDNNSVKPYMSYICGLLHNIGLLLFNAMFPREFALLKKWLKLNPNVPITFLENRLIAMEPKLCICTGGHAQLGAWLLRYWEMPEEACIVAREHHHPNYSAAQHKYVQIVWLANRILKKNYALGDGSSGNISSDHLALVGISSIELDIIVVDVMSTVDELSNLAGALVSTAK